jgi:hypothetical protein
MDEKKIDIDFNITHTQETLRIGSESIIVPLFLAAPDLLIGISMGYPQIHETMFCAYALMQKQFKMPEPNRMMILSHVGDKNTLYIYYNDSEYEKKFNEDPIVAVKEFLSAAKESTCTKDMIYIRDVRTFGYGTMNEPHDFSEIITCTIHEIQISHAVYNLQQDLFI